MIIRDCSNDATRGTAQTRILGAALFAVLCAQGLVVAQPRAKVVQQGAVEFRGMGQLRIEVVDAVRSSRIVFRSVKTGKTINPLTRNGRVASRSEFAGRVGQALAFKVEDGGVTTGPLVLISTVFRGADHCAFSVRLVGESAGRLRLLTDRPFETDDMGGLYVGDLGGGRGRGVAVWDFVWSEGEAHFDAHRYEVKIYKYLPAADRFVRSSVMRSKQRYVSWEDAARELQLPYANALPVCEELFDGGGVTLHHGARPAMAIPAVGRQKSWLAGTRPVRPETARDVALESALVDALYDGDASAARRDRARYNYNRVDLNDDGQLETLVFLSAPAWCGSAGCVALVFQQVGGKYALVTQISGVENPIIVSRKRTNGWHDLIAHVRWGEVGGSTLRDYSAVLRYDGHTYPDQFPGAPPLGARESVSGTAYFGAVPSPGRGLALAPVTRRIGKRR